MKKLLQLSLASTLALSLLSFSSSAYSTSQSQVEETIRSLNIMSGDSKGNLNLEKDVNRAEFVTMIVARIVGDTTLSKPSVSPYPDVPPTHWASGYVAYALQHSYVSGYSDGTFKPDKNITLGEVAVLLPYILGYTAEDFPNYTMDNRVSWLSAQGLLENVEAKKNSDIISRKDTMYLFYNALTTGMKSGSTLYENMGYTLTSSGEIDRVALLDSLMEGPVLVSGNWEKEIPFDLDTATVWFDAALNPSSIGDIQENHLVYWVEGSKTLWVYDKSVIGTLDNVTSTEVTMAGIVYPLETEEAKYQLSNLGSYREGQTVIAVLGKEGGIAEFTTATTGTSVLVGIFLSEGTGEKDDGAGGVYEVPTVTLLGTDGKTYTFHLEESQDFAQDRVYEVSIGGSGQVKLEVFNPQKSDTPTGVVDSDKMLLGSHKIASDIEIIDCYEDSLLSVDISRLDGLTLDHDDVRYYSFNPKGELNRLILEDVTGENHLYAIVLDQSKTPSGTFYSLVVDGIGKTNWMPSTPYDLEDAVAIRIRGDFADPDTVTEMRSSVVTDLGNGSLSLGSAGEFYYAQELIVFEKQTGGNYYASTLARVMSGDYEKITAYYMTGGDRYVRILLAE